MGVFFLNCFYYFSLPKRTKTYLMNSTKTYKILIFTACVLGILYTSGGIARMIYKLIINLMAR